MRKLKVFVKKLTDKAGSECGQSIVEFALAIPLLLTILCGILDFGWIYSNQYKVEYAAYTGARYAVISASNQNSDSAVAEEVRAKAAESLVDRSEEHVTVTVNSLSRQVTVEVSYPVKTLTFVASTVFGSYYNVTATNVASY